MPLTGLPLMTDGQIYFTPKEAADFLRFSSVTLAIWRSEGRGPKYLKMGPSIRYQRGDLEFWANATSIGRKNLEILSDCHTAKLMTVKRPRGRAGAALRAKRLAKEPFCRDCLEYGLDRPSTEVDHIVPLSKGGTNEDGNIRCLCKACHAARTRTEFFGERDE